MPGISVKVESGQVGQTPVTPSEPVNDPKRLLYPRPVAPLPPLTVGGATEAFVALHVPFFPLATQVL